MEESAMETKVESMLERELNKLARVTDRLIARAWSDEVYRKELFIDTEACFQKEGYTFPRNMSVEVSRCFKRWMIVEDGQGRTGVTLRIPFPMAPPDYLRAKSLSRPDEAAIPVTMLACSRVGTAPGGPSEVFDIKDNCRDPEYDNTNGAQS